MGHHVVGVQAEQQVREEAEVEHLPALRARRGRAAPRRPTRRRGSWSTQSRRGPSSPPTHAPGAVVVVARVARRTDAAQLRMDQRAVVALVVVLDRDLPVRRELVVVRRGDARAARTPSSPPARRRRRRGAPRTVARRPTRSRTASRPTRRASTGSRRDDLDGSKLARRRSEGRVAADRRARSSTRGTGTGRHPVDDTVFVAPRRPAARGRGGGRCWRRRAARRRDHA